MHITPGLNHVTNGLPAGSDEPAARGRERGPGSAAERAFAETRSDMRPTALAPALDPRPRNAASPFARTARDRSPASPPGGRDVPRSGRHPADFHFAATGVTQGDREEYRLLELEHPTLFLGRGIREVDGIDRDDLGVVKDVEMGEAEAVNGALTHDSIGTTGLSTCIAICARGLDAHGDPILGLHHYDGRASAREALDELRGKMTRLGATDEATQYHLIGGLVMPAGLGSLEMETDLLAQHRNFNIVSAVLHPLEGEYDADGNEHMLSVVMTPFNIYFSRKTLYSEPSDSD